MIYVLIPAYNEAPTVGLLLWKVRQVFTEFAREYQIVVVNDGSTDATGDVLAPYARALPLTVISHRVRQGYARSLDALFRLALERTDRPRRDVAVTLQADFSDAPADLPELVKRLEGGADIVVADRSGRPARTGLARLAGRLLPPALRATLRLPGVRDYTGSLRGYRLGVIERLVRERGSHPLAECEGRAADIELLVRAARHARKIESVPASGTTPVPQRSARGAPLRDGWTAWRSAWDLRTLARTPVPTGPRRQETEAEPAATVTQGQAPNPEQPRRRGGRGRGRGRGRGGRRPVQPSPTSTPA